MEPNLNYTISTLLDQNWQSGVPPLPSPQSSSNYTLKGKLRAVVVKSLKRFIQTSPSQKTKTETDLENLNQITNLVKTALLENSSPTNLTDIQKVMVRCWQYAAKISDQDVASQARRICLENLNDKKDQKSEETFLLVCKDGKIELPEFYKKILADNSDFFKKLFQSPFRERESQTINLDIPEADLKRLLDLTFDKAELPEKMSEEELMEFGGKALFLDMQVAFQKVQNRLVKFIENLEFTQEHFDFAIAFQNRMNLLGDDERMQEALDTYFQDFVSNISNSRAALEFLEKNGSNLPTLDLIQIDDLDEEQLNKFLRCCPNVAKLSIKPDPISAQSLQSILSAYRIQKVELDLTQIENLDDEHLNKYIKSCPSLTKLSVKSALITDKSLESLSSACPLLQKLELSNCTKLTDKGLEFLSSLPRLQLLDLGWNDQLTVKGITHLLTLLKSQTLKLSLCIPLDDIDDIEGREEKLAFLEKYGKNLISLDLTRFKFVGQQIDKIFEWCPNLKGLSLDFPLMSDELLKRLSSRYINLQKLVLRAPYNKLTEKGLEYLSSLKNLQSLTLEFIPSGFDHLSSLTKLRTLEIHRCKLKDENLDALSHLVHLQRLHLTALDITDQGLAKLRPLINLTELTVKGCIATDDCLPFLAPFSDNLRSLDFSTCEISDKGLPHIARLANLRKLIIPDAIITDKSLISITQLVKLQELNISEANLTEVGLASLHYLINLKKLTIPRNNLTNKEVAKIIGLENLQIQLVFDILD